jgi:S-adenosylhomocysteine hydrolase
MPLLAALMARFAAQQPFKDLGIAACLHIPA